MTIRDIEIALVTTLFNYRQYFVVPNISWGMQLHECDLLVLTNNNYAWEIEIKTSFADIKKDREKTHNHWSNKIALLYFAMPEKIYEKSLPYIPERAGIVKIIEKEINAYDPRQIVTHLERKPIRNKIARPWSNKEILHFARLGNLRYWKQRVRNSV